MPAEQQITLDQRLKRIDEPEQSLFKGIGTALYGIYCNSLSEEMATQKAGDLAHIITTYWEKVIPPKIQNQLIFDAHNPDREQLRVVLGKVTIELTKINMSKRMGLLGLQPNKFDFSEKDYEAIPGNLREISEVFSLISLLDS